MNKKLAYLGALIFGLAFVVCTSALVSYFIEGTTTAEVSGPIELESCTVDKGTCNVVSDIEFSWDIGIMKAGSEEDIVLEVSNTANNDIDIDMETVNIATTGGDGVANVQVTYNGPKTVPAGSTATITQTVTVNSAEEVGTTYDIESEIVPA